jgi:hypothetical protein
MRGVGYMWWWKTVKQHKTAQAIVYTQADPSCIRSLGRYVELCR